MKGKPSSTLIKSMKTNAQQSLKKRKHIDPESAEPEKNISKLPKLDQLKQGNLREFNKSISSTKLKKKEQVKLGASMGLVEQLTKLASPTKAAAEVASVNMEPAASEAVAPMVQMVSLSELNHSLETIATSLQALAKGQLDQAANHETLVHKVDTGFSTFQGHLSNVSDRVKALEESRINALIPRVTTPEERHELSLQADIDESKRCVTALGTRRDTLSIKDVEQLILTNKLAEKDEVEVLSVRRMGNALTANPAFRVELKSAGMATSLIENSKIQSAKGATTLRCVVHYPFEYSERAREMKAHQGEAWRKGLHSQIYFEGTEMRLKVKERSSNRWMIYPSEFGQYKPHMVMSAIADPADSEEAKAARDSLLRKLNVKETNGKLIPCEKSANSLIFSSKGGHLNEETCMVKLPQIFNKYKEVRIEAIKPCGDLKGEYQTRLIFSTRKEAKEALQMCIQSFKSEPLASGDFLTLELLWVS